MADNVIKFGKAKKALQRQDKEKTAASNRAKFGRTKAEKKLESDKRDKHKKTVDYHKRDKP